MMLKNKLGYLGAFASAAIGLSMPNVTIAQPSEGDGFVLEEILVTARRREESLQDVPIAVTAVGETDLNDLQINSFGDVGITVPNLNAQTQFGSGSIVQYSLRGQDSGLTSYQVDSRIGLYIDGVYLGRTATAAANLASLCQLEVLRGPQGTLFGRNSTGGAVNFRTCDPKEEFGASIDIGVGNYDQRKAKIVVDTGVHNGFSARLAFSHTENDGYVDNLAAGTTTVLNEPFGTIVAPDSFGSEDSDAFGLALKYDGETFSADYRFDYTDKENTQLGNQLLGFFTSTGTGLFVDATTAAAGFAAQGAVPASASRLDSLSLDFTTPGVLEVTGHALTLEWAVSDEISIKNITSYREFEENTGGNDLDGNVLMAGADRFTPLSSLGVRDHEQLSNELQILGAYDDAGIDWIIGAFYFTEEGPQNIPVLNQASFPGNALTIGSGNYLAGGLYDVENESSAVYAHINYQLNDQLRLSAGVRYTKDDREELVTFAGLIGFLDGVVPAGTPLPFLGGAPTLPTPQLFSDSFNYTDWDLSLTYNLDDDSSIYAKVATAHLSGGVLGGASFLPEESTSYEIGLKSDLLDGRLRLNAALFMVDVEDLQVPTFSLASGSQILTTGESEQAGFELEITALLSDRLTIDASYGYVDVDLETEQRSLTPESTAYLGINYEIAETSIGLLNARLDASWTDDTHGLICSGGRAPTPTGCADIVGLDALTFAPRAITPAEAAANQALDDALTQRANTQLGMRLSLSKIPLGNDKYGKASIWGKNLLDTDELEYARDVGGRAMGTFQIPRTVGVDFSFEF